MPLPNSYAIVERIEQLASAHRKNLRDREIDAIENQLERLTLTTAELDAVFDWAELQDSLPSIGALIVHARKLSANASDGAPRITHVLVRHNACGHSVAFPVEQLRAATHGLYYACIGKFYDHCTEKIPAENIALTWYSQGEGDTVEL